MCYQSHKQYYKGNFFRSPGPYKTSGFSTYPNKTQIKICKHSKASF